MARGRRMADLDPEDAWSALPAEARCRGYGYLLRGLPSPVGFEYCPNGNSSPNEQELAPGWWEREW